MFFGGQFFSLIGTWMDTVAQSWLVYRLTGSSAALGGIGFTSQIPVFLLSPLGGIIADRYNRHSVIVITQIASMAVAATLAAVTFSGHVRIWQMYLLAGILGIVNAFDIPARQAFLSQLVPTEDLMNAIALNSSMFNASRIVGPAIAGMLVAHVGEAWCFSINAVSYIAVLAGLFRMNLLPRELAAQQNSPLMDVIEGFRFVWASRPIRALLALIAIISLAGLPFAVLMPVFADRVLHGGPKTLGWLMGASGVGALAGALLLASRQSLTGLGKWVPLSAAAFAAALVVFAFSRTVWLSMLTLVVIGFSMMIEMGASNTLIQSIAPDRLRGRVMSVYSMMFMGMAPLGALLAGAAAEHVGAPWTVAAGALICLIASVVFAVSETWTAH